MEELKKQLEERLEKIKAQSYSQQQEIRISEISRTLILISNIGN